MPDQYVPYPSPITPWGSPAATQAVDPGSSNVTDPSPPWSNDPSYVPVYSPNGLGEPIMTPEEALAELQNMFGPLPDSTSFVPDPQADQTDMFLSGRDTVPQFVLGSNGSYPLQPVPQLLTPHGSPTHPVYPQLRPHAGSLSPLFLNAPSTHPPSPPHTSDERYLQSHPYVVQQAWPVPSQPATQQVQRRPREPERMVLPGPGDPNASMCEIIM